MTGADLRRGLCLAALLLSSVPCLAAAVGRPDFRPRAAAMYAGDPSAGLKLRVEDIFGLYLVDPPRRHASERVELEGERVVLHYWQPASGFSDAELTTRATQWFLLGRTQFSPGVRALFSEMPATQEVVMVFHEVVRKDQRGRRLAEESVTPYMRVRLTRKRFERLKLEPVQACVDRGDCQAVFRAAFDEARFDRKGIKLR